MSLFLHQVAMTLKINEVEQSVNLEVIYVMVTRTSKFLTSRSTFSAFGTKPIP